MKTMKTKKILEYVDENIDFLAYKIAKVVPVGSIVGTLIYWDGENIQASYAVGVNHPRGSKKGKLGWITYHPVDEGEILDIYLEGLGFDEAEAERIQKSDRCEQITEVALELDLREQVKAWFGKELAGDELRYLL